MNAATDIGLSPIDRRTAGSASGAVSCVADVSVDGATLPMVCFVLPDGAVVIPITEDCPPVADVAGHLVRIEFHRPRTSDHPGRALSIVDNDYLPWRLGAGVPISTSGQPDDVRVCVVASLTVPRSMRKTESAATRSGSGIPAGPVRRPHRVALAMAPAVGFLIGWRMARAVYRRACG